VASKDKAGRVHWSGIPVALKVLALSLMALVALLVMLPAPPDNKPGGVTTISRYVPALRDTVDPLATDPRVVMGVPEPTPPPQYPSSESIAPEPALTPAPEAAPSLPVPPVPVRKPVFDSAATRAPVPETSPEIQIPTEQSTQDVARLPSESTPDGSVGLPSKSEIRDWVKSQAWEFLGGVDEQGNILYRFEVWLDAPSNVIGAIKTVSYEYDAPSATPKTRESVSSKGGFRARFGALACAKEITITVTMADGRTRRVGADGCQALN
jgi:hypothetical protein